MEIKIWLFGGFSMQVNDIEISGLNSRHHVLLAYLAIHHPEPVPRSELAFTLWADSNEEQALTNLRKALHQIKQKLYDREVIQIDSRMLQLNPKIQIDLVDFTSALDFAERAHRAKDTEAEQAALEAVAAYYRSDLLPSFYDEWLVPKRNRLRDMFIQATDRLIALLEGRRHYRDAIKHAQRLLQTDNLREETYRTLIRLHALNNDRAAALNVYHTCAGVLSKELGVEPDSSTRELYERLLKNESRLSRVIAPTIPISHPLVARDLEWKTLLEEWKKSTNGELRTVLLSGEAGIGKTRLAEELINWVVRQGIRTISATCYSAEQQISFVPITSWLRAVPLNKLNANHIAELSRLLPELRNKETIPSPMIEKWQRQFFFQVMAQALLAEQEPLVLLLDDIQWCDNDSLAWLRYFLHFDKKAKILLILTLRAEEFQENNELQLLLLNLRAEGRLTDMELTRLDEKQTVELGLHLLGRNFSEADLSALFHASEGVPLFVVELANTGFRVESARDIEAGTGAKEAGLPPRLKAILEGRLARLSSPARAVIESAAIIGRKFDFDLLLQISELDEGVTINALDELWRLQIIREDGEHYDFSHDKLREVTLAGISPIRLRWLHQRAGEALIASQFIEYASIAGHFEIAGLKVQAAMYYARAAAQAQEILAFVEALDLVHKAIMLETEPDALAQLYEQKGDILQIHGQSEDAFQAFEQALGLAESVLQRARLARKQITLTSRHAIDTARQKYAQALTEIEQVQHDVSYQQEWIELQFAWIQALYWKQDADAMDVLLAQTHELVEQYGTPAQKIHQAHRVINSGLVRELGRLDVRYLAIARENIARAETLGDSHLISTTRRTYGLTALFTEQFSECIATLSEVIVISEKNGDFGSLLIARVYISLAHRRMKDIEAVREDNQALLDLLQQVGKNPEYQGIAKANLAWLAYREDRMEAASQYAQAAYELWRTLPIVYPVQWVGLSVLFALAVDAHQVENALDYVQAMLAPSQQRLRLDTEAALHAIQEVDPANHNLVIRLGREAVEKVKEAGYL